MAPRFRRIFAATAALALLPAAIVRGFDLLGSSWADGNIVMQLQLGQPGTGLLDGSVDWATVAESALTEWNQVIQRSKFTVVRDSTAGVNRGNRLNNVVFRSDIYGEAFGDRTLAVTLGSTSVSTGRSLEKDVIFNSGRTWNSYRGNLRSGVAEFRRVALHEFGHVLGLDHPDQAEPAQTVPAVMNSVVSNIEVLQPDDIAGARALYDLVGASATPSIAAQPQSRTVAVGDSYTLAVTVNGTGPFTYTWSFRSAATSTLEGFRLANGPSYTIGSVQTADAGTYTVNVSGPGGSVTSSSATLGVTPVSTAATTTLANISTRGSVGSGNGILIAGVVVGGTEAKTILLRAAGPGLTDFGVAGALQDPTVTLVDQNARVVAQNDNWDAGADATTIRDVAARVGAFQFKAGSRDAALVAKLPPGSYTALVSGVGGTTGAALVEAYDADGTAAGPAQKLVNIATRGRVGTGDELIAGLVVTGPGPHTYLIRAVGPTLANAPFSVTGALNDPFLQLYQGETLLRENDDWDTPASAQQALRDAATKVGAFQLGVRRDSAMLVTLRPGSYTAKVTGFQGASGIALIEIYEVP